LLSAARRSFTAPEDGLVRQQIFDGQHTVTDAMMLVVNWSWVATDDLVAERREHARKLARSRLSAAPRRRHLPEDLDTKITTFTIRYNKKARLRLDPDVLEQGLHAALRNQDERAHTQLVFR
jgi:hypothetical protein